MRNEHIPFMQLVAAFEVYNKTLGESPQMSASTTGGWRLFDRFVGPACSLADVSVERRRELGGGWRGA